MPFATATDQAIIDAFTGKNASYAKPTAMYIGLSSTTPTKTGGSVTEPTVGNYARIQVTSAQFDSAADIGGTSTGTSNNAEKAFAACTVTWASGANMTHLVMYDAITTGTFIGFKALTVPKPVFAGDTFKIAVGDLDIVLGGTF